MDSERHVRLIFLLIMAASFLDQIDSFIIQVAIPSIRSQFAVSLAEAQWVVGAYGITLAGFLLLSGRAGDVYGQKKIFVIGMFVFTVASLAGGLAPSFLSLVVFRLIQGVGAAMTTVTALAIFIGLFREEKERIKYYGIFVASFSAGAATGLVAGGVLTLILGWRWVLLVNVPLGLAIAALSQKFISSNEFGKPAARLDLPGAFSVTSGLILLVYALTNAANDGIFSSSSLTPLGVAFAVLVIFLLIESRTAHPLVPMGFLRRRSTLLVNVLCFVVSCTAGTTLLITVYFQTILGWSPLYAAIATLPVPMTFTIGGVWAAAKIQKRLGLRQTLLASLVAMTCGAALLTRISTSQNYLQVSLPGMVILALGASLFFPAIFAEASVGSKPGEEGLASGVINTSFRVGIPVGLALLLTVVSIADPTAPGTQDAFLLAENLTSGLRYGFLAAALFLLLGFLIAMRITDAKQSPLLSEGG